MPRFIWYLLLASLFCRTAPSITSLTGTSRMWQLLSKYTCLGLWRIMSHLVWNTNNIKQQIFDINWLSHRISMWYIDIFTYIYHKNQPNAGKYTIHGSYGYVTMFICLHGKVNLGPVHLIAFYSGGCWRMSRLLFHANIKHPTELPLGVLDCMPRSLPIVSDFGIWASNGKP